MSFFGVPYHLMTHEVLDSLCQRFGSIEKPAKFGPMLEGKVLLKHCDVRLKPQFIPLVDIVAVVHLIKIVLEEVLYFGSKECSNGDQLFSLGCRIGSAIFL